MDTLRQYVLSVICAALLCGMLQMLFRGAVMKLVAGLIVTIVAINPVLRGELQLEMNWEEITINSLWAIKEGEDAALQEMSAHIKAQAQSYILSKAEELDANISAEVELSGDVPPVPAAVTIQGDAAPFTKKRLAEYIEKELGVDEDRQRWIS